jgi:hypothetical protein
MSVAPIWGDSGARGYACGSLGRAVKKPRPSNGLREMICKFFGALLMFQEWVTHCLPLV